MPATKTKLDITHTFPSLRELVEEAVLKAKGRYNNSVKKDRASTNKLLRRMNAWLVAAIGEEDASAARYDVNYNVDRPYDNFSVCISFDKDQALAGRLSKKLRHFAMGKCFPFKFADTSRQDTVGLTDIDFVVERNGKMLRNGKAQGHGYMVPGLYLQFSFVEW